MRFLHSKMYVHFDMKEENTIVMVGQNDVLKVIDLGNVLKFGNDGVVKFFGQRGNITCHDTAVNATPNEDIERRMSPETTVFWVGYRSRRDAI